MPSLNKAIIIGHVGRDPEIRSFSNGGKVANFSIATSESWKDKASGERKERVDWHRVSVLNEALVGVVEKYLKKGAKVYIEGQIETRKYEKDGREMYTTEIVLRPYRGELKLLDGKKDSGGDNAADADEPSQESIEQQREAFRANPMYAKPVPPSAGQIIDDEVPF